MHSKDNYLYRLVSVAGTICIFLEYTSYNVMTVVSCDFQRIADAGIQVCGVLFRQQLDDGCASNGSRDPESRFASVVFMVDVAVLPVNKKKFENINLSTIT